VLVEQVTEPHPWLLLSLVINVVSLIAFEAAEHAGCDH